MSTKLVFMGLRKSFKWLTAFLFLLILNSLGAQDVNHDRYFGMALAGGEWGPFPTNSDMDYQISKGLKLIRLPIKWEMVQPVLNGPLDASQMSKIKNYFAYAEQKEVYILIDLHNYCRRKMNGIDVIIGSTPTLTIAHLQDFWSKLTDQLKGYSSVWGYGLMNEPHDMDKKLWFNTAQALITSIRALDTKNTIVVGGHEWSSANSWPRASDELKNLKDPNNNLMFEAHCYFDDGSSLKYRENDANKKNANIGVERVKPFVEWINRNNLRGFVGEFGVPRSDPEWAIVLDNYYKYLSANCVNGAYWAAGSGWPTSYDILAQPINGVEMPVMATIAKYKMTSNNCLKIVNDPIGPLGYTFSTSEYGIVPVSKSVDIAFGVDGKFIYLYNQTSDVTCNVATFKEDPAIGSPKHCWIRNSKTPFNGSLVKIPGTVQAENFDEGGQGVSYNDEEPNNLGNMYRTEGVDIDDVTGGGYAIGWTETGEWLEYTVFVEEFGTYDLELLVSSLNGGGEISITQTGRSSVANIPIIKTGDWDTYAVQKIPVYLMPNQHALRLKIEKGGFNIDKMVFKKQTLTEIHSGNSTESITLFPNPSKDGFINLSKETKWSVKTLVGQELMNGNGFQINLSSYSKGIYLIEFNEKVERVIVE